ncbi:hypothetical protein [Flavobacterium phage FPSV-S29]|nr:hypothetical protein [Flavobacterium phage FPSV-S29]
MEYIEKNHISKNADILLKHFQENIIEKNLIEGYYPNQRTLENKNHTCSNNVVIENYWIKLSEYLILYEQFKTLYLSKIENIELEYTHKMTKDTSSYVILLKIVYKTIKELQLNSKTTYIELEIFFHQMLRNKKDGEMYVFNIGKYGAILFHSCVEDYINKHKWFTTKKIYTETNITAPNTYEQYVIYSFPFNNKIKLLILDTENKNKTLDNVSGFYLEDMLLKFKEVVI